MLTQLWEQSQRENETYLVFDRIINVLLSQLKELLSKKTSKQKDSIITPLGNLVYSEFSLFFEISALKRVQHQRQYYFTFNALIYELMCFIEAETGFCLICLILWTSYAL